MTWSSLPTVEQAIQDSLESRRPVILVTDCPEVHQALYGALLGVCGDIGTTARDGTQRFSGGPGEEGRQWDVRLRLEVPRPRPRSSGACRKVLDQAQEDLTQAMACYMRERSTQAATAVGIAIVNCEQARADIEMDRGEG